MESFSTPQPVDEDRRKAFQALKPRCIAVSQHILTSKPDPRELTSALSGLLATLKATPHGVFNAALGDYVFFPLSHVFRQHRTLNDRAVELALQCVDILINTVWRIDCPKELAKQLLIMITFIIGGSPGEPGGGDKKIRSQETVLAGVKCLLGLFGTLKKMPAGGVLGDAGVLPAVGHTVTTLLEVLSESEMVELAIAALDAIATLELECLKDKDMIASFYPGTVSGLVKVIGLGKTSKRPSTVLAKTAKVLGNIICRVLGDMNTLALPDGTEKKHNEGKEELKVQRTKAWLTATAAQTKLALENVLRLRTHPKSEVRTAIFELCRDILENCTVSLEPATEILVESMIVFAGDEDNKALARLSESTLRVLASSNENVKEAIQSSLHGWIVALPRIMGTNDEDTKTRVITRLSVAFCLMTELGIESELLQDMLASNIRNSLSAANAKGKGKDVGVVPVRDKSISLDLLLVNREENGVSAHRQMAVFPDVVMGHRSQKGTMESMKKLLALLGSSSEKALVLAQRHIREAGQPAAPAKESATSLWIALNLLQGSLSESSQIDEFLDMDFSTTSAFQRRVTEELFSVSLKALDTTEQDGAEETEGTDPEDSTLKCLALESLSLIAQTQKKSFRGDLVDALYPVVHLLGSSSPALQNHAIVALNNIAYSTEYASAKELLLDNVDYMVNAVALKLNAFDLSPQAPVVLGMMIKLAGSSLVPYLDDLVVSIFAALEGFHGYEKLCQGLFGVLGAIVEESAKGELAATAIESGSADQGGRTRKRRKLLTGEELVNTLKELANKARPRIDPLDEEPDDNADEKQPHPKHPWIDLKGKGKNKQLDPDREPSLDEDDGDNDPDSDLHAQPPPEPALTTPTKSYEMVQNIARLSQHYLTHTSPSLRLQLLTLISTAAPLLSPNENEYLPLINTLWPPIISRLSDPEPHIIVAAATTISTLAATAGDFLTSRIKDAFPVIKRVYSQASKQLEKERNRGVFSPAYRVWDAMVGLLTAVAENVDLGDDVVDMICEIVGARVLNERRTLREALERVNPEAVWLEIQAARGSEGLLDLPVMEGVRFFEVVF